MTKDSNQLVMRDLMQKIVWLFAGADYQVLKSAESSWQKYYSLGVSNIISCTLSTIGAFQIVIMISGNVLLSVITAILWLFALAAINNYIFIINSAPKRTVFKTTSLSVIRISIAAANTFIYATAVQIKLFGQQIQSTHSALSSGSSGLLQGIEALVQLKHDNNTIFALSWAIYSLFFSIEILPLMLSWLVQKGEYEYMLELRYENAVRRAALQSKARFEIEEMEHLKLIKMHKESLEANETEQNITPEEFGANVEEAEFYINYKSLPVNELNTFFEALVDLYNEAYLVMSGNNYADSNLANIFKTHPEDTLVLGSIETGNSITFRVKTGWKPKFDAKDGDIEIAVPKGALSFIALTGLIAVMFEYGISRYKDILEIEKLKEEKEFIHDQRMELKTRLQNASDSTQANFQKKLTNFYNASIANDNFKQLTISQDITQHFQLDSNNKSLKSINREQ